MVKICIAYRKSCSQSSAAAKILQEIAKLCGVNGFTAPYSERREHKFLDRFDGKFSRVFWTTPPSDSLAMVLKDGGYRQTAFIWSDWFGVDDHTIGYLDACITPFQCFAQTANDLWGSNCVQKVYWDLPMSKIQGSSDKIRRLAVSAFWRKPFSMPELSTLEYVRSCPGTELTILTPSKKILEQARSHQFETYRTKNAVDHLNKLATYDVAIFPDLRFQLCTDVLLAKRASLPIFAFDIPPCSELVQHKVSSVLVPCDIQQDRNFDILAVSPFAKFSNSLEAAIQEDRFKAVRLYVRQAVDMTHQLLRDSWTPIFEA